MIGLLATFLVVAYLLVPSGLFRSFYSLFLPRIIKFQRSRAEEFTFAVLASVLPFFLALFFVWNIANWPFGVSGTSVADRRAAYRVVVSSAMSDKILDEQVSNHVYWAATNQVIRRQARFLIWYYVFVLIEAWVYAWMTRNYGRWSGSLPGIRAQAYRWIAKKVLLPSISEWHVLLTPFTYPPDPPRQVWVDVLTSLDVLYKGRVTEYFLDKEGELSGIFLGQPRRFDRSGLLRDIKEEKAKRDMESYWRDIPSNNLYISSDKIINLNVRYLTAEEVIALRTSARLSEGGWSFEVRAVQCRCANIRHGHENPCKSPATENDQMCKACHDAAANEFAGTQQVGHPQSTPPASG